MSDEVKREEFYDSMTGETRSVVVSDPMWEKIMSTRPAHYPPASAPSPEVRVTDPKTGGQKGRKPEAYALIPAEPLMAVAAVYGEGFSSGDLMSDLFTEVEFFRGRRKSSHALASAAAYALELMVKRATNEPIIVTPDGDAELSYSRIPAGPLAEVARVYHFGCYGKPNPYAPWNWLKGYDWSLSFSALGRHVEKRRSGIPVDDESKLDHWAHVIFHLFTLYEFDRLGLGTDDRQP